MTRMENLSLAFECYNSTVKSVTPSLTDLQSIVELELRAESNALECLRNLPDPGTKNQQECTEEDLKRLIASNLSAWKIIAIELVNAKKKNNQQTRKLKDYIKVLKNLCKDTEKYSIKSINDKTIQVEEQKKMCEGEKLKLRDQIKSFEDHGKSLEENYLNSLNCFKKQLDDQQKIFKDEKQKLKEEIRGLEYHIENIGKFHKERFEGGLEEKKLKDELEKLTKELNEVKSEIENLKSDLKDMEKSRDYYKPQVALAVQHVDNLNQSLQAKQAEEKRLIEVIQQLYDSNEQTQSENQQINAQKNAFEEENKKLKDDINQDISEIRALKSTLKDIEESVYDLKCQNQILKQENKRLQNLLSVL